MICAGVESTVDKWFFFFFCSLYHLLFQRFFLYTSHASSILHTSISYGSYGCRLLLLTFTRSQAGAPPLFFFLLIKEEIEKGAKTCDVAAPYSSEIYRYICGFDVIIVILDTKYLVSCHEQTYYYMALLRFILKLEWFLGHPRFFNQLSNGVDVISMAGEWLTATANTNMFTYEISPVFILMEHITLKKMREIIGYKGGDSILAPGPIISTIYWIINYYKIYLKIRWNCGQLVRRVGRTLPQVSKGEERRSTISSWATRHVHFRTCN